MLEPLPSGCGCEYGTAVDPETGEKQFVYKPCSMTCRYYIMVLEESKMQGKPIEER